MAARSSHNFSITEAVETLSSIADLEFDHEIGIAQQHELILQNEKIDSKPVHWLNKADAPATVHLVREIFRVILHYLKGFYKKEYGYVTDQNTIEGIKTIMVLVGEAAKKLDRYTHLFNETKNHSVTQFKEYKQLQDFYLTRIARRVDEGVLSKWIFGLSIGRTISNPSSIIKTAFEKQPVTLSETKHVFVDLETVKKDTEYELFFIRKDDGTRFFSPRLLRNIKLVCNFGSYFGDRPEMDPLEEIKQWHDRILHTCSKNIIKAMGSRLQQFYHDVRQFKNQELVILLNKTLMALLLSSHAQNLLRHSPKKCCSEYFEDFQGFLREALHHRDYQKWLAYPPKESNHFAIDVMNLIHSLCRSLYSSMQGLHEISSIIQSLLNQAIHIQSKGQTEKIDNGKSFSKRLSHEYIAMTKLFKYHPNGPLLKVLDILQEDAYHVFDPLMQHNVPNQLYDLYMNEKRITHFRMPSPIFQETISKACLEEEFKGFLRSYNQIDNQKKHLLINLQDKTSWREHARCSIIEDLANQTEFKKSLCVVTLATDTDFYHQLAPYYQNNHAQTFMHQFKEHILGENSGYFFPSCIDREELSHFIDQTFESIHKVYFSSKNVLLREHRMNFIEVFYLMLQLKLIEWVEPDSFSLTCKDSIDIGESFSIELFMLLKIMNNQTLQSGDWDYLNLMLYGPSIITRERIMLPERFHRMVGALKLIENTKDEMGPEGFAEIVKRVFSKAYKVSTLNASVLIPRA